MVADRVGAAASVAKQQGSAQSEASASLSLCVASSPTSDQAFRFGQPGGDPRAIVLAPV
jgi:hypothetical protein